MPRRPRVFVDGATHHVERRFVQGARVFAAPEEAFELQVAAVEAELRRRSCVSGAILVLPTTPDLDLSIDACAAESGKAAGATGR